MFFKPYETPGLSVWADRYIRIGDQWRREIGEALSRSRIAVMLVSPNFLASDFITKVEMPAVLDAVRRGDASVAAIPISAVDPAVTGLEERQWARAPEMPLDLLTKAKRNQAFVEIVRAIVALASGPDSPGRTAGPEPTATTASTSPVVPVSFSGILGTMYGVPAQRPHFMPREELRTLKIALLRSDQGAVGVIGTPYGQGNTPLGVQGMGGIGKTVLAIALVNDDEVRRAFPDGIYWLTLGQEPDLLRLQGSLIRQMGGEEVQATNVFEGREALTRVLGDKASLLVLDDVWTPSHADAFNVLGGRGRLLMTTRDGSVVKALGATAINLDVLSEPLALRLLAEWSGVELEALPPVVRDVARECGYLPLALSLAGARVRDGVDWDALWRELREGHLEFLDHPYGSVFACLRLSVDALSDHDRERYGELAVFPEDTAIPATTVCGFWEHTGGLTTHKSQSLLARMHSKALVIRHQTQEGDRVGFHDLQHDFLRLDADNPLELHAKLIAAYRQKCPDGWATGPNDGYYFQWLPYHLAEAGQAEELRALLLDYRWLAAKLKATSIQALIADYDRLPGDDEDPRLVRHALVLSVHVLAKADGQGQLPSQLIGRLVGLGGDGVAALLAEARKERRFTWLRPLTRSLTPAGGPLLRALPNFDQDVTRLAISADARRVGIEFDNGSVEVWDLKRGVRLEGAEASGDEFGSLEQQAGEAPGFDASSGHRPETSVTCLAVSEAGNVAISGGEDWELKLWDVPNRRVIATLPFHQDSITAVTLTPDGRRAVSAARGTVMVWDLHQAQQSPPDERKLPIKSIAFAAESGSVVVAFSVQGFLPPDHVIRIWDLASGREVDGLKGHEGLVTSVAVSADGHYVVSGSKDETVRVWDKASPSAVTWPRGHSGPVKAVAITPDGRFAVSGSGDNTVRIWDVQRKQEVKTLKLDEDSVDAVAITPDGRHVIAGTYNGIICHWDFHSTSKAAPQCIDGYRPVLGVAITPGGDSAIFALDDGSLRVWDLTTEADVFCLSTEMAAVSSVAITPDGRRAVSGSDDKMVRVWDLRDRREIARFTAELPVSAVACGGNAQIIAGDGGGQIHILELIEEVGGA
ncbi:MAG: NB-ARC domain-containing protein [Defluviicoccus sp.]|nr:NB-ARC domain-containing protein [Defluviicoccus sp.]MDG4610281.1 NB-ARC domain-containing protein [Defluviicoccus sp.]